VSSSKTDLYLHDERVLLLAQYNVPRCFLLNYGIKRVILFFKELGELELV
jgi:hypothetical protein